MTDLTAILFDVQKTIGALEESQKEGIRQRQALYASVKEVRDSQADLVNKVQRVILIAEQAAKIPALENRMFAIETRQDETEAELALIKPTVSDLRDTNIRNKATMATIAVAGGGAATALPYLWKLFFSLIHH